MIFYLDYKNLPTLQCGSRIGTNIYSDRWLERCGLEDHSDQFSGPKRSLVKTSVDHCQITFL